MFRYLAKAAVTSLAVLSFVILPATGTAFEPCTLMRDRPPNPAVYSVRALRRARRSLQLAILRARAQRLAHVRAALQSGRPIDEIIAADERARKAVVCPR